MEMFTIGKGEKKMLLFPTGRVYKCSKDIITECKPKIEVIIDPKTFKVYKFAYIYFEYTRYSLAKLIALAFLDNPNGFQHVNRKDGNPNNNAVENLEWVSDRRNFPRVSREQLLKVDYESLGTCNKAVYQLLVHGDESGLLQLVTRPPASPTPLVRNHSIYRYLYHSLAQKGIPTADRELRMDEGYELLKRRLQAYYMPVAGMRGEGRFRKYSYFCYLYNALDKRGEKFIPRELARNINSDEVSEYF